MSDIIIRVSADDQASDSLRTMNRNVDSLGSRWESVKDTIGDLAGATGVVVGLAAATWEAASAGEGLRDLGVQFDTYLSRIDADANMMEQLRGTTRGLVDDATLMRSAVDAYRLAGATTEEQILELINIGNTLGGGREGVEALIGVLRQGSSAMEVLDTAGLSAGNVRQRWMELKETMEDSDEAFRLAVLEEGREQLGLFGEGLAAQASAIERWQARLTNAWNSTLETIGAGVNTFLETAVDPIVAAADAGVLDVALRAALFGTDANREIIMRDAEAQVAQVFDAVFAAAQDYDLSGMDFEPFRGVLQEAMTLAVANPDVFTSPEAAAQALEMLGYSAEQNADLFDMYSYSLMAYVSVQDAAAAAARTAAEAEQYSNMELQRGLAIQERYAQGLATVAQQRADFAMQLADQVLFANSWGDTFNPGEMMSGMFDIADNLDTQFMDDATEFFTTVSDGRNEIADGIRIFRPEEADTLRTMADEYQAFVDRIDDDELFDDATVARFQTGADAVREMAEQAQRGADALKDMSLDQLLGVTDGGAAGQLTDEILAAGRQGGLTEAQLAEFQALMDAESGRSSEASTALMEEQIPLILASLETNSAEAATALAMEVLEGLASNAAGLPVEWSQDGFTAVQDNIATPMAEAQAATEAISSNLATLTASPQVVTVQLNMQAGTLDALAQALFPLISRGVSDNGGRVPGTNVRDETR